MLKLCSLRQTFKVPLGDQECSNKKIVHIKFDEARGTSGFELDVMTMAVWSVSRIHDIILKHSRIQITFPPLCDINKRLCRGIASRM